MEVFKKSEKLDAERARFAHWLQTQNISLDEWFSNTISDDQLESLIKQIS